MSKDTIEESQHAVAQKTPETPDDGPQRALAQSMFQKKVARRAAQRREGGAQATAEAGVAGASQPLPHGDAIQKSFGHHDVSGVRAAVGGEAAEANHALGASGFAKGDKVAFAEQPDLRLAAHEAAHTVQQSGGVHLSAGLGSDGDAHEQHADAVAEQVVAGRSAEPLLDQRTGGAPSVAGGGGAVQRQLVPSGYPNIFYDTRITMGGVYFTRLQNGHYLCSGDNSEYAYDTNTHQFVDENNIFYDPATGRYFYPRFDNQGQPEQDGNGQYYPTQGQGNYDYNGATYVLHVAQPPQQPQPSNNSPSPGSSNNGSSMGRQPMSVTQPGSNGPPQQQQREWKFDGGYWTETRSGMMYFPPSQGGMGRQSKPEQLRGKDYQPITDGAILSEIRSIHQSRGGQEMQREKEERQVKKTSEPKQKSFNIDQYIGDRFDVVVDGEVIYFHVKGTSTLAGQISHYTKGKAFSFDLNKNEKYEGQFSGISYLMVYYLLKHVAPPGGKIQIEAFHSGRDTGGLVGLYMNMGLSSGMDGDIETVMYACAGLAAQKFG